MATKKKSAKKEPIIESEALTETTKETAKIEVVEEEVVVPEKKVFQGKIDVSKLDETAVNAIAYYNNGGVEGKQRLEAIIRSCVEA